MANTTQRDTKHACIAAVAEDVQIGGGSVSRRMHGLAA